MEDAAHARVTTAEVEAAREAAAVVVEVRAGRPIVTVATTIVGITIDVIAAPGSREEHLSSFARI